MIIREKSTKPPSEARINASSVALSSCCVVQYTPVPFVNSFVVFSKASPSKSPLKNTSEVAVSHATMDGPAGLAPGAKDEVLA